MPASSSSRDRLARHRASQRQRGLRSVAMWLPDVGDPSYRALLEKECRRLSVLTPDEEAMANEFTDLTGPGEEWQ